MPLPFGKILKKFLKFTMLRKLRKERTVKKSTELDDFLGNTDRKYYIEKNYREMKLFRYLLFLREKGANLNKFFDEEIQFSKKADQ